MKSLTSVTVASLMLLGASASHAAVISFDDYPVPNLYGFEELVLPYKGLDWTYWGVIRAPAYPPSGYVNGIVSGLQTGCGCAGDYGQTVTKISAFGQKFTLGSGSFISAWTDASTLLVEGYAGGLLVASLSEELDTTAPERLEFNWTGLDEVRFSISGGVPTIYNGPPGYFGVDDLDITVTPVPEPSVWIAFILGFGVVGLSARRQRLLQAHAA